MSESNPYRVSEVDSAPIVEGPSYGARLLNELSRIVIILLLGMGVCFVSAGAFFFVLYWIGALMSGG